MAGSPQKRETSNVRAAKAALLLKANTAVQRASNVGIFNNRRPTASAWPLRSAPALSPPMAAPELPRPARPRYGPDQPAIVPRDVLAVCVPFDIVQRYSAPVCWLPQTMSDAPLPL